MWENNFIRFTLSGIINTILTYVVYAILSFYLSYDVSYLLAFTLGVVISLFLNSKFVFRSGLTISKTVFFPVIYICQFVLGVVILKIMVEVIDLNIYIAPVLVSIILLPLGFLWSKKLLSRQSW